MRATLGIATALFVVLTMTLLFYLAARRDAQRPPSVAVSL